VIGVFTRVAVTKGKVKNHKPGNAEEAEEAEDFKGICRGANSILQARENVGASLKPQKPLLSPLPLRFQSSFKD
jgi:hypothetical protein